MRKLVVLAVLLAVAGAGYWFFVADKAGEQSQSIVVSTVVTGDLESLVTASGTLEPKDYVDVGAQVSGQIENLHVDIGDSVKKGDLLAEIDPDVYVAEVAGDEAKLKTLNAQYKEQKALLKQAEQKLARNRKLVESRAVSQETFEDAQTDLEVQQAQLMSLEAQIEEAKSTLEKANTNLNYTKIYATMAGTVVSLDVTEGQTINANQSAPELMQIADLDVMTVRAEVAEADVMKLTTGMPVYFTTLGSQERRWEGVVRQILPTPEVVNDVVLYNVLVDVDNEDHSLMTGMTTQVFFVLGQAKNVPLVAVKALRSRVPEADTENGTAYKVLVQKEGGKTEAVTVVTGLSSRSQAEVISGLEAGQKVVEKGGVVSTEETSGRGMRMRL